jgi:hypothetical protein
MVDETSVGGLIGYADDAEAIVSSHASGAVKGANCAAGLVGYSDAAIRNSYATGNINGGAGDDTGGLVG